MRKYIFHKRSNKEVTVWTFFSWRILWYSSYLNKIKWWRDVSDIINDRFLSPFSLNISRRTGQVTSVDLILEWRIEVCLLLLFFCFLSCPEVESFSSKKKLHVKIVKTSKTPWNFSFSRSSFASNTVKTLSNGSSRK